jgi:hypothetical protein
MLLVLRGDRGNGYPFGRCDLFAAEQRTCPLNRGIIANQLSTGIGKPGSTEMRLLALVSPKGRFMPHSVSCRLVAR